MKVTQLFLQYRLRFSLTLFLILLEVVLDVLFPLFIGLAIDDAIHESSRGVIYLGSLGVIALVIGVGRRVFDSRFYAKIYEDIGSSIISKMKDDDSSKKSARLGMIGELIEFLENSLPELINSIVGLLGVVLVIATLNLTVFYGSLVTFFLIFLVYWASSNKTIFYNKSSNDELEKQVDIISKNDKQLLNLHLKKMMKWNIKLSDLEALNFSISWIILIAFLVISIIIPINDGLVQYGALFALIMYVFQYIENITHLPYFYQHWLRLAEIKERLEQV